MGQVIKRNIASLQGLSINDVMQFKTTLLIVTCSQNPRSHKYLQLKKLHIRLKVLTQNIAIFFLFDQCTHYRTPIVNLQSYVQDLDYYKMTILNSKKQGITSSCHKPMFRIVTGNFYSGYSPMSSPTFGNSIFFCSFSLKITKFETLDKN